MQYSVRSLLGAVTLFAVACVVFRETGRSVVPFAAFAVACQATPVGCLATAVASSGRRRHFFAGAGGAAVLASLCTGPRMIGETPVGAILLATLVIGSAVLSGRLAAWAMEAGGRD